MSSGQVKSLVPTCYRLCPGIGGNGVQWIPKATVLAQGLCLTSLELDSCLGACVVALPAGTLLCPCSAATWTLGACAAGGKTALRGALALPCTLRPCSGYPSAKAAAGNTWVLPVAEETSSVFCPKQEPAVTQRQRPVSPAHWM